MQKKFRTAVLRSRAQLDLPQPYARTNYTKDCFAKFFVYDKALYIFFSPILPVGKYFFHLLVNDMSKNYSPQYHTLIDIPTAVSFFGRDQAKTRERVVEKVHRLVEAWNKKFTIADGKGTAGKKAKQVKNRVTK
jgi:hypothetical protein